MAKKELRLRSINQRIWKDEWFIQLRMSEQYLWLYLLTNAQTDLSGIYQITLREMAFDTGIDQEEIKRIFRDRFETDKKAFYELGWVIMPNWLKNQNFSTNHLQGVSNILNGLPLWLRQRISDTEDGCFTDVEVLTNGIIVVDRTLEPLKVLYSARIIERNRKELNRSSLSKEREGAELSGSSGQTPAPKKPFKWE